MRIIIVGLACIILSVVIDALFLPHQSLWNDEATQMVGISLDPVEVTRWLAGRVDYDFGVPDDRMPPLSYLAGWAWSKIFGLGERPMRWFGVCCIAIATGIVYASATRAWGIASGAAAGLLMATSPNVIVASVEIRAYPVLILASSGLCACLMGYAESSTESSRKKWLIGMLACGVSAIYIHFFGLVILGGCFVGAFAVSKAKGEKILPVVATGCLAGLLGLGLGPFVFASTGMSSPRSIPVDAKLAALVRLIYRLVTHPSMAMNTAVVVLAVVGLAMGICCALAPKRRSGWASMGLGLALISGFAVVSLAHLGQSLFPAASTNYNIWMLPALMLFLTSGLAADTRGVRIAAVSGILMLLTANTYAAGQLIVRGDAFTHNPHRHIASLIRQFNPQDVAVIHDDDNDAIAWMAYGPIHYEFGGKIPQFFPGPGQPDKSGLRLLDFPARKVETNLDGLPFSTLIVIREQQESSQEIASKIRAGGGPLGDGPVVRFLLASKDWERVDQKDYLSLIAADIDVFRKVVRP